MNSSGDKTKESINKASNDNNLGLLKEQFVRSFIKFQNETDIASFISALEKGKGKISPEIREEMRLYHNASKSLYPDLNINSITQKDFTKKLAPEITKISNMKSFLRFQIQNIYDINDEDFENQILPTIDELKYNTLREFISGKGNIERFIDDLEYYKIPANVDKKPKKRELKTFLESFGLQEKWKSLSKDKQMRLYRINQTMLETPSSINTEDIGEILEIANLSASEKKSLMQYYFPVISVGSLRKHNIINEQKANELKKNFVINGSKHLGLSHAQLQSIIDNTEYEDVIVSTRDFSPKQIDEITKSEEFQKGLRREVEQIGKEFKKQLIESLPKDLGEFQKKLTQLRVNGAEKFKNGSIIVTQINANGVSKTSFSEIKSDSSMTGQIQVVDKGVDQFYASNKFMSKGLSQEEFISQFKKQDGNGTPSIASMAVYSADEFEELLKNGTFKQFQDQLKLKSKQEIETEYNSKKESLLESGKTSQEIEEDNELKNILLSNDHQVAKKLDEVDPNGDKFGFKKGITFETTSPEGYWTILGAENNVVELQSVNGRIQKVGYEAFVEGFTKMKSKRVSEVLNLNSLLESISRNDKLSNAWKGISIDGNGFIRNEKIDDGHGHTKESSTEFPYLVSNDGNEYIKILSISNNSAEIQFGTVESSSEKGKDGKTIKKEKYSLENGEFKVSLGFLDNWIRKHSLEPKTLTDKDTSVADKDSPHDHRQWSFVNWYFSNLSLHTMLEGFHDIQHSIEHKLEAGTKEQASRFALSAFSILPYNKIDILNELRAGLKSDTEGAQKKRMDEAIEHLGQVDTPDAIDEICHWLHYTNTPEYKIHAALMYMIQKYGVLCAKQGGKLNKGGLIALKGDFVWYKALGGRVNDGFFKQVQKDCESGENGQGIPFSEEELVYRWLKELARQGKIRSRLHKEFKKSRAEGKEKEYETGNKDGGDERGPKGRLEFTMGELKGGNYPNALGGLEMLYKKGSNSVDLEQVPFILAFSGICYDFDGKWMLDKMKNFPANGYLSPILRFLSYPSQMDMINETILEITRRISELEGNSKMYQEAKQIFDHRKSHADLKNWGYQQKIAKTEAFYKKYGAKIIPALTMAHDGNAQNRYSGLIKTEKDDGYHFDGKQGKGNILFKRYYDGLKSFTSEFKFEAESIFDDLQRGNGISGLDLYRVGIKRLFFSTGGKLRYDDESTMQLIEEIKTELKTIPERSYTGTDKKGVANREIQKKVAKKMMREILASVAHNHGADQSVLGKLNSPTGAFAFLTPYGVQFTDLIKYKANEDAIIHESNDMFEKKLDEIAENVISGGSTRKQEQDKDYSLVQGVIDSTKIGVNKNSKKPANSNDNYNIVNDNSDSDPFEEAA